MTTPQDADLFTVPLIGGGVGWGQVVEEGATPRVALSQRRGSPDDPPLPLALDEIFAILRVPDTHFREGHWQIRGFEALPRPRSALTGPEEVQDPAVVEALFSAWHGLLPWDYFPGGDVFGPLLRPGVSPPG